MLVLLFPLLSSLLEFPLRSFWNTAFSSSNSLPLYISLPLYLYLFDVSIIFSSRFYQAVPMLRRQSFRPSSQRCTKLRTRRPSYCLGSELPSVVESLLVRYVFCFPSMLDMVFLTRLSMSTLTSLLHLWIFKDSPWSTIPPKTPRDSSLSTDSPETGWGRLERDRGSRLRRRRTGIRKYLAWAEGNYVSVFSFFLNRQLYLIASIVLPRRIAKHKAKKADK